MNLSRILRTTRSNELVVRVLEGLPAPVFRPLRWAWRQLGPRLSRTPIVFDDRSTNRRTLLIVLAGYKPQLWPVTMARLARHHRADEVDVCIVCSGHPPAAAELRALAAEHGWSFLQSEEDQLAHAQNLAIEQFPNVEWVAKIDEDMFVTAGWIEKLKITYEEALRDGRYRIGFVAPVIPINGFGYRVFLELTGQMQDYVDEFPGQPPVSAANLLSVHESAAVGEWMWRKSQPLDERAEELALRPSGYSVCPHRFSIGAILLRRETWVEFGGFAVASSEGMLGYEEGELCKWCMDHSRVIVISHSALVAHFSFFPQWEAMLELLEREPALFH